VKRNTGECAIASVPSFTMRPTDNNAYHGVSKLQRSIPHPHSVLLPPSTSSSKNHRLLQVSDTTMRAPSHSGTKHEFCGTATTVPSDQCMRLNGRQMSFIHNTSFAPQRLTSSLFDLREDPRSPSSMTASMGPRSMSRFAGFS